MKYKSGNIYFTPAGAFMFMGPENNIELVNLFRVNEDTAFYPERGGNSHQNNLKWLQEHSNSHPILNITDLIKENWYEI